MIEFCLVAILFSLINTNIELRLIRRRLGGTLAFWPWNED